MKAKQYQRKLWKQVDLKELNKHLKTHKVSSDSIENEIVINKHLLKKEYSNKEALMT